MHLTLLVVAGPRAEGGRTAGALGRAALDAGHRVTVFLAGDGTAHAAALAPLRDAGATVVSCSADAAVRGWDAPGAPGRGSFVDLGSAVAESDCVVVL